MGGPPPTATPDGVEYGAGGPQQAPGDQPPASKVQIEQRNGKYMAVCYRQGDPRPTPSPLLNSFEELVAYLAQEFGVQPAQAAAPPPAGDAGGAPPDDSDYQ